MDHISVMVKFIEVLREYRNHYVHFHRLEKASNSVVKKSNSRPKSFFAGIFCELQGTFTSRIVPFYNDVILTSRE